MDNATNTSAPAPSVLRRLARDNREMGRRLARHEFRVMSAELKNPNLFELSIDFGSVDPGTVLAAKTISDDPIAAIMPRLNVTLGRIAWVETPADLPVMGLFVPDAPARMLTAALIEFMTSHHAAPFVRPVFLCQTLRPIPFLGRYGFTYDVLGDAPLESAAERLRLRYGMQQIRDLVSGDLLTSAAEQVAD